MTEEKRVAKIQVGSMQVDSLLMQVKNFANVSQNVNLKLYRNPKINVTIKDKSLYTIGIVDYNHINFFLLTELGGDLWWSAYENLKAILYHRNIFRLCKDSSRNINHVRFQLGDYRNSMAVESINIENSQVFLHVLSEYTPTFFYSKGGKLNVPFRKDILEFNSMVQKYSQQTSDFRVDWSFNFFQNDLSERRTLFLTKIDEQAFPCCLKPTFSDCDYLKNLRLQSIDKFKYQFGFFSGRTFKFKLLDIDEKVKVSEILFYYHNTINFRNSKFNKVKSTCILYKWGMEKFRPIFCGNAINFKERVDFMADHLSSNEYITPRVEVRCFDHRVVEKIFIYYTHLYDKNAELTNIEQADRNVYCQQFNSIIRYLTKSLKYTNIVKHAVILEEVLHILLNGYNPRYSILKSTYLDKIMKTLLSPTGTEISISTEGSINSQLNTIGMNFMEKEIDQFIFNLFRIMEDYSVLLNEFMKDNTNGLSGEFLDKLKKLKKLLKSIINYVLFYQLIIDILMEFDEDPSSARMEWVEMKVDGYEFLLKQRCLMGNFVEDFINLIQSDLPVVDGNYSLPKYLKSQHTIRKRERQYKIRVSIQEWLHNIILLYNDQRNPYNGSSRKMFLILQSFLQYYKVQFSFQKLFESVLERYRMVQLPEIGVVTVNINSYKQFVSKFHTSNNQVQNNYFIWVMIKQNDEVIEDNLLAMEKKLLLRGSNICKFLIKCTEKLPSIVSTFVPSLEDNNLQVFAQLDDSKFTYSPIFKTYMCQNRNVYLKYRKLVDRYIKRWYASSAFSAVKKISFVRIFVNAFGIIIFQPQGFLTKKVTKSEFVKEFPFFSTVSKALACNEIELKKVIFV